MKTYQELYQAEIKKGELLTETIFQLQKEVDSLNRTIEELEEKEVLFYLGKLKDREFTTTYGEGYTWYYAAEELGRIGKPAIPYLIENLETKDDYERTLTLYALLLASQDENVKEFAGNDYIDTSLDFNIEHHDEMKEVAYQWWGKYQNNWE